jgi:N-acetylglucosaminyldiphosphoundecaprenol N-acetyl-beta-D-mannosaminyltransferase
VTSTRLWIGPVPVDVVSKAEALARIEGLVTAGRGGRVFTPNVDHVVLAHRDEALRRAYARAELCTADGAPLVFLSRLSPAPLPERVAGSDLVEPVVARAAERGWPLFLLGGGPGVADEAAARWKSRYPRLAVAGTAAPRVSAVPTAEQVERAAELVRAAAPRIVLVALGAPKQELFIDALAAHVAPAVLLGIGAALDFVAGRVRRAPAFVSRVGAEWLFRLAQEPRRLAHRYLVRDATFPWVFLRHGAFRVELRPSPEPT